MFSTLFPGYLAYWPPLVSLPLVFQPTRGTNGLPATGPIDQFLVKPYLLLRFPPYSRFGPLYMSWTICMILVTRLVIALSFYMVPSLLPLFCEHFFSALPPSVIFVVRYVLGLPNHPRVDELPLYTTPHRITLPKIHLPDSPLYHTT